MMKTVRIRCLDCDEPFIDASKCVTFRSDELHHCASLRPAVFNGVKYHDVQCVDCNCSRTWRRIVDFKMQCFQSVAICKRCLIARLSPDYYPDHAAKLYAIQHLTRKDIVKAKCAMYEQNYRVEHMSKYDNPDIIHLIMHGFQLPNELCRELCNLAFLLAICKRCLIAGLSPDSYPDHAAKSYAIQHITGKDLVNAKCAIYEQDYRVEHVRKYDNPESIYYIMHGLQLPNELCRELCNMTFLH